jgi:hypothetical protein
MTTPPTSAYRKANRPVTTVTHRKRNLVMYSLQKHEVDVLRAGYSSPCLGLFGLFAGASLALWLTYEQWSPPDPIANRIWSGCLICAGLAVICGFLAVREWWNCRTVMDTLTEETVEFVVEEKRETTPQSPPEP